MKKKNGKISKENRFIVDTSMEYGMTIIKI